MSKPELKLVQMPQRNPVVVDLPSFVKKTQPDWTPGLVDARAIALNLEYDLRQLALAHPELGATLREKALLAEVISGLIAEAL